MTLPQVKESASLAEFLEQITAIAKLNPVTGMFVALELDNGEHVTTHQFNIQDMHKVAELAREYAND